MDPALALAGLLVGSVVGLCGVGGGALMTPFLIYYGVPPLTAVGTDLVYALFSKSIGAWLHHRQGTVNWPVVRLLALGSLPAALACLWLLQTLAQNAADYQWLVRDIVGLTLVLTACTTLLPARLLRSRRGRRRGPRATAWLTLLTGILLGVLVTLSSIGSGALGAAALLLLYPAMPILAIVGTDLLHAVPLIAVAAAGHWALGNVDFALLVSLLPGAALGVWLGTRAGKCLPPAAVRRILAVILLGIGIKMIAA